MLTATNDAQAPAVAARLTAPWSAWKIEGIRMMAMRGSVDKNIEEMKKPNRRGKEVASDLTIDLVAMTIDHRPGGRVLQGPPMRAVVAPAKIQNPYANANIEGANYLYIAKGTETEGGASLMDPIYNLVGGSQPLLLLLLGVLVIGIFFGASYAHGGIIKLYEKSQTN